MTCVLPSDLTLVSLPFKTTLSSGRAQTPREAQLHTLRWEAAQTRAEAPQELTRVFIYRLRRQVHEQGPAKAMRSELTRRSVQQHSGRLLPSIQPYQNQ
jgi:hypothetical protein